MLKYTSTHAVRQADRLVATQGAIQREILDDGVLVALTDPAYRAYLGHEPCGRLSRRQTERRASENVFENGQTNLGEPITKTTYRSHGGCWWVEGWTGFPSLAPSQQCPARRPHFIERSGPWTDGQPFGAELNAGSRHQRGTPEIAMLLRVSACRARWIPEPKSMEGFSSV